MEQRTESAEWTSLVSWLDSDRVVAFVDMESYSRRVGEDEVATLDFMSSCFETIRMLAAQYDGTLIKTLGDGALLVFEKAVDGIVFATELHRGIARQQAGEDDPFLFRIGLHLGHIRVEHGDIYGNTVNIASRLQEIAAPGETVVSQQIFEALPDEEQFRFETLGSPHLRNIQESVRVYRVLDPDQGQGSRPYYPDFSVSVIGEVRIRDRAGNLLCDSRLLARALLGYLALCPGHADSRERLEMIMGHPDRLNDALKDVLFQPEAPFAPVRIEANLVVLDAARLGTDIEQALEELRRGRVPAIFSESPDWPNYILLGFDQINPVFKSWLLITRQKLRRRVMRELERIVEQSSPDDDAYEEAADAILMLEPGNETAALARIVARTAHGDRVGALAEYERLKTYLTASFDLSPSDKIQKFVRGIMSPADNRSGSGGGGRPPSEPPRRSLLLVEVKAFNPGAVDADTVAIFRTELIANLTRFRDWSIIDGVQVSPRGSDEARKVDYCIEASTLDGKNPRLAFHLVEQATGRNLWADTYELGAAHWGESQRDIVRGIAATMETYISSDRLSADLEIDRTRATMHDAWLRGDMELMRWSAHGAQEARRIFEGILRENPDHAPSLFRLASIHNIAHVIWPGRPRHPDELAEADRLASRAEQIDPMDARVQRTVAWSAAMTGAFARASMHLDLAVALNPNDAATMASCAMGFAWIGEREKADATMTRRAAVNRAMPQWGWAYDASTNFFLDRLDTALEAAELGGDSIADTQGWTAAIRARRGEMQQAGAAFRRFYDMIEPIWQGTEAASAPAVADWFANAFPLRNASDRARLIEAIGAAMRAA